ncbi:MAG: pseudouridine synthase [Bacteroidia bacterium]
MPKEFKRRDDKSFKGNGNNRGKENDKEKKSRPDKKRSDKPAFERYRDDARPSEFGGPKRSSGGKSWGDKPAFKKRTGSRPFDKEKKNDRPFDNEKKNDRSFDKEKTTDRPFDKEKKSDRPFSKEKRSFEDKPAFTKKKPVNAFDLDESDMEHGKPEKEFRPKKGPSYERKPYVKRGKPRGSHPERKNDDGTVRLNKYIANAGICSRREADDLISSGVVQVNGKVVTEMGYKVKPTDVIRYGGQTLKKERLVYLILNKPKDYITTSDDPMKRRTVLELIKGACKERIYPVGRLDRATTGLLMFTNDGELTKKLTHPRYGVRKIYHVEIDKPLKREDLDKISSGLELEDGEIKVDEITYVGDGKDKTQIGIELHSGKNRIVRRIFEHLGYNVRKLDRVMFGSLTKKDLPRGRWRLLTESEVGTLKMISSGK